MDAHVCGKCGHLWAAHTGYGDYNRCLSPGCVCERSQANAEKYNNQDAREAIAVMAAYIAGIEGGKTFGEIAKLQKACDRNPLAAKFIEEARAATDEQGALT